MGFRGQQAVCGPSSPGRSWLSAGMLRQRPVPRADPQLVLECPVPHRRPPNHCYLGWRSSRPRLAHLPWCSSHILPVLTCRMPVVKTFSFFLQNLAYEIILTLGQAFEVAYQLALQARKGGHSSTLPESFENKPSKPVPKPRVSIRKSVVSRNLRWEGRGRVLGVGTT